MLKFQDNYTTLLATFEDFILLVYTIIDDLYQQVVPTSVSKRRNVNTAKLSDPEMIPLSICGELLGIASENAWYSFVKRNYRHLFPNLCCRTRFNRTRRNLLQVTELLRQNIRQVFPVPHSRYYALITLEGYITAFEITPASVDDREGLRDLAQNRLGLVVLGDKGYTGKLLWEDMMKPSNYKENWPKEVRQLIFRFRRRVETVCSQLAEQTNAERVLAKSFRGLCTRLQNKILGHNLCMAFNSIFRKPCEGFFCFFTF